jgi:hypothetical protein
VCRTRLGKILPVSRTQDDFIVRDLLSKSTGKNALPVTMACLACLNMLALRAAEVVSKGAGGKEMGSTGCRACSRRAF